MIMAMVSTAAMMGTAMVVAVTAAIAATLAMLLMLGIFTISSLVNNLELLLLLDLKPLHISKLLTLHQAGNDHARRKQRLESHPDGW
jgi:hypothetical protein